MHKQNDILKRKYENTSQVQNCVIKSISHELRNPLNSLYGAIRITKGIMEKYENIPAKIILMLNTATNCCEVLTNLIENFIDANQLFENKVIVNINPTHFLDNLDKIMTIINQKIEEKGLDLFYFKSKNIPDIVHIDINRITQVAMNLLDNAVKFTKQGRVICIAKWTHSKNTNLMKPTFTI